MNQLRIVPNCLSLAVEGLGHIELQLAKATRKAPFFARVERNLTGFRCAFKKTQPNLFDRRSIIGETYLAMPTPSLSRKDRERKAREELIVEHATRLLINQGFQGFSLDDLAKSIEYSKGTIYLHFESKEDLALAVATAALKERADLFERAVRFNGKSRERARAIGFACCHFMVAYPEFFSVEMMMKSQSFWEKASEARRQANSMQAGRTFRAMMEVVHAGFESGDLPRGRMPAEHIAIAMASVTVGSHIMSQVPEMRLLAGIDDSIRIVRQNQDLLLDGMKWTHLLADYDYEATDRRIRDEIFPEATWFPTA
jgi:AcrR family transcriptional regulator